MIISTKTSNETETRAFAKKLVDILETKAF